MPVNILEEMQADQIALELGLIDKESLIKRYQQRYGVDYETVKANIEQEKSAANVNNANIGAQILRNFNQGNGAPMNNQPMQNQMMNNANQQPASTNQTAKG
jgi:GTP cyclohydrolase II